MIPTAKQIDTWRARRELRIYAVLLMWALVGLASTRRKETWL